MSPVFEGFCHEFYKGYLLQELHQGNSQRPFTYAIYVVVLLTTVKHLHNRRVGKLASDKCIH